MIMVFLGRIPVTFWIAGVPLYIVKNICEELYNVAFITNLTFLPYAKNKYGPFCEIKYPMSL